MKSPSVTSPIQRIREIYQEYPRSFWMLVIINFIDKLGGSLIFPFFALYITKRYSVGMTEVGGLFAIWGISGFTGSFFGGALTDRMGRKGMIIFSLIATSLFSLAFGFVPTFSIFMVVGFISGLFTDIGGPAYNAVVADLLPEEKRAQGYGIIRVAFNLSAAIGPAIGGLIAAHSYLALFITDAVISLLAAAVVFFALPETNPKKNRETHHENTAQTFRGYLRVLKNGPFMVFTLTSMFAWFVYMNMNTTLGVYLRNVHGIPDSGYGYLLSLNALMVVMFQFPITRRISKIRPMLMMALGAIIQAVGFAAYGIFSSYIMFMIAMALITIAEMIMVPVANAQTVNYAPEDMRGRYSFVYGLSWGIAFTVGPYLAGLLIDGTHPNFLWFACGVVGALTALGFLALNRPRREKEAVKAVK